MIPPIYIVVPTKRRTFKAESLVGLTLQDAERALQDAEQELQELKTRGIPVSAEEEQEFALAKLMIAETKMRCD